MARHASELPPSEGVSQTEGVPGLIRARPMPDTPEKCTCGAVLAENARFCHRCGRPVFELTAAEEQNLAPPVAAPVPPPAVVVDAVPLPIGFGNPIALRVAFLMSLGVMMASTVASIVPVVSYFFLAWWLGAGWAGVRLYRRLTGLRLSVGSGARLGFLTGMFAFLSMAVVSTLTLASSAGRDALDQMVRQMKQDPRLLEVVNDPAMLKAALFGGLLLGLIAVFAMVTGVCAAGGALGAKFGSSVSRPGQ